MIFHDQFSMTIERFILMHRTQNLSYILKRRVPMPNSLLRQPVARLMSFVSSSLFGDEEDFDAIMELRIRKLRNLVNNLLPSLYNGLLWGPTIEMKDYFKQYFRKDFKTEKDLFLIQKEQKKLLLQLRSLIPENDDNIQEEQKEIDFEELICGMELTLGIPIDRHGKVFQIGIYYKKAVEAVQSRKKVVGNG